MDAVQRILQDLKSGCINKTEGLRLLQAELKGTQARSAPDVGLYAAEWREEALGKTHEVSVTGGWLVLLVAPFGSASAALSRLPQGPRSCPLPQSDGDVGQRYEELAVHVLDALQQLLREPTSTPLLVQVVISATPEDEVSFGVAAMLRTVEQENPRIRTQVIGISDKCFVAEDLAQLLDVERAHHGASVVRYRDGVRETLQYTPLSEAVSAPPIPWRNGGVYALTGGAGGLGVLFAREILHHAPEAHVVLFARSSWSGATRVKLEALGAHVHLRILDVTDPDAVDAALQGLKHEFGTVTGILHAAGVLRDGFAVYKRADDLAAVCAPKVRGLLNLEQASRTLPLELFISFSSLSAVLGNIGQVDYALANAFLDRRALQTGRSVSIDWPLWSDGGMRIDQETGRALRENLGLTPISTPQGFAALYRALASRHSQVVVAAGDQAKLSSRLNASAPSDTVEVADLSDKFRESTGADLRAGPALLERLKTLFSVCTGYPEAELDALEPLERYGIDSIMITRLNQRLAEVYPGLSKTLLYEHRSLGALATHLLSEHTGASLRWSGMDQKDIAARTPVQPATAVAPITVAQPPRQTHDDAIAIIGLSGCYPRAASLSAFWNNLREGVDCIDEIPAERWPLEGFFEPDRKLAMAQGKSYGKWGSFVDDFADFDPLFFGMSPREAMDIDPQERLFMRACYDVLEDAAVTKEDLAKRYGGRVGVYVGITKTGFSLYGPALWQDGETLNPRTSFSSAANRVSYALNLNGPSLPLDTMCSSSLTAIHEACRALRAGDCSLAIAGGVNLYLHPSNFVELSASQMLSADGRCKSFGEGGNGFVPGEGVGCVLLKPLAQAQADGDQIHAVILATHINHGGKTHGYTVPNPTAQRDLVRAALDKAGVDARTVSYIEAHGTGTEMGDPIEIEGLTQAFRYDTDDVGFCAIGSVKSNIGHLEAAAGIAGLTKILLQLKHRQLAPSLHADVANPNIDFARTPFVLQRALAPWRRPTGPHGESPLRAAISAFGAGGANAHVVLEEYLPAPSGRAFDAQPNVIVLSARTAGALQERAARLLSFLECTNTAPDNARQSMIAGHLAALLHVSPEHIESDVDIVQYGVGEFELQQLLERLQNTAGLTCHAESWHDCHTVTELAARVSSTSFDGARLADIAYTLQVGRDPMAFRFACVFNGLAELTSKLSQYLAGDVEFDGLYLGQMTTTREQQEALEQQRRRQLERAVSTADLAAIAGLWVAGQTIPWRELYRGERPRRVSLPTYPYARNTYWIAEKYRRGDSVNAPSTPTATVVAPQPVHATTHAPSVTVARVAPDTGADVLDFIERTLVDKLCETLRLSPDEIRPDDAFADYGLDSILGVYLVDSLNAALGVDLETTCLFDYSSVNRLTAYLKTRYSALPTTALTEQMRVPDPAPLETHGLAQDARARDDDIAIVGVSGHFGGSADLEALWEHLAQGHDLIEPVTRWPLPEAGEGTDLCRHGSFVEGIADFDPLFFNISGVEATYMDPQQRHFLQEAWKALENAGYAGAQIAGTDCGVYVGCCGGDYQDLFLGKPSTQSLWGNMASLIPSRIAYYLDLKGPCMAIDSACSSSLVAIDLACKDLRSGETSMALAGGVFLQASPKLYTSANRAGMLSASGRCHAFDAGADGFVPGEGVGVVVLKRLSQARIDGDHIHGVIVGSGVNQDGTTNGITAPSGKSQEALLRKVYDRFDIDAGKIQMMEAHGTGTRLGDPIEFSALTRAFRADSDETEYCALGSIKTNLGHTQYAAGVAGVIKVLLSLRHRQIPPSLNYRQSNPAIALAKSPFFVNTRLLPWPQARGRRMAAVSAFGAGGTNAHLVIAEAPENVGRHDDACTYLIVLSARSASQLRQQAEQLLVHCRRFPETDCGNISFTLLMGRKHLEHRMAWLVADMGELMASLTHWLTDGRPLSSPSQATAPSSPQSRAHWNKLSVLAATYVNGETPDCAFVFAGGGYRRIPLPTYPFARDTYWLRDEALRPEIASPPPAAASALSSIQFAGDEFFLEDHVVRQHRVLPAVVSLELARQAFAVRTGQALGVRLSNVVWLRPVTMQQTMPALALEMRPLSDNRFEFKIGDTEQVDHVYTQGFVQSVDRSAPHVDLTAVRALSKLKRVSRQQCYEALKDMGIEHGPRLQAVVDIEVGEGLALARLNMPASTADSAYMLHPAMMDSAIQASIGLVLAEDRDARQTALPFALDEIDVFAPCSAVMVAVIRSGGIRAGVEKFDVDLCDPAGAVCVRMRGYSSRVLEPARQPDPIPSLILQPVWDAQPLPTAQTFIGKMVLAGPGADAEAQSTLLRIYPALQLLTLEPDDSIPAISAKLAGLGDFDHLLWIGDRRALPEQWGDELLKRQQRGSLLVFRLLKAMLVVGCDARDMRFTVLTAQALPVDDLDDVQPADAGLHGMFGSLAKEYTHWAVRTVDLDATADVPFEAILALPFDSRGDSWVRRRSQWHRLSLLEQTWQEQPHGQCRHGGVYVVLGGAGGVGAAWSEYMIRRYQARIIWVGRRPADEQIAARLATLGMLGPQPHYIRADAADRRALQAAADEIKRLFGAVHGVVHSTIVLRDQSLARMDEERFTASYRAKADVAVRMAEVFGAEPLDFMLFFSSIQSFARMPGQSNYAAGSTFNDTFAHFVGRHLSVNCKVMNWGYWGTVGVVASPDYQQRMAQAGLASIDASEAMAALEVLFASPGRQAALVKTTRLPAVDGMSLDQRITMYPEALPPLVGHALRDFQPQQEKVQAMRTRVGSQMSEMDTLLAALLFVQLRKVGLFGDAGIRLQDIRATLPSLYHRWMDESIVVLLDHGLVRCDGDLYSPTGTIDADASWQTWEQQTALWLTDENRRSQVQLAETMLRALPDIISRKRLATDAMFPNSSLKLVEGIYKNNLVADYFNEVLADVLIAYIEGRIARDPETRIRILEIGAGTGGTSARLFPRLRQFQANIEEYCYTDLSRAFLMHAEREYGADNPYLTYRLFDVSKPLAVQDMPQGYFDVVIATNVLHATRNIRSTMRNAKAALQRHGLLLLNELSDNVLFSHLTFGLLEGWWLYDDSELRIPGSPGLYPRAWQQVLESEGFRSVAFPAEAAHVMGQQIVVAESDGAARQPVAAIRPRAAAAVSTELPEVVPVAQPVTVEPASQVTQGGEAFRDKARHYFKQVVSDTILIPAEQIGTTVPLDRYGVDSILVVQLTSRLRAVFENISSTLFFEVPTIDGLIDHFQQAQPRALAQLVAGVTLQPQASTSFPELIQMNNVSEGRPVFWIHHANGGIEAYQSIAQRCRRPFYGIRPKGYLDGDILVGQQARGAYYASIIRSVQPEGPYDLGGFSLGGLFAYEVARQLQVQGAEVATLVMLDALDSQASNQANELVGCGRTNREDLSKINVFRAVNLMLGTHGAALMLHRDEVDTSLPYTAFLDFLIDVALERGVNKNEAQLRERVLQLSRYFDAVQSECYQVLPLPDRDALRCYYVRNKTGIVFGSFEPYTVLYPGSNVALVDNTSYWNEWSHCIDDFHLIDVDVETHDDIPVAPKSLSKILRLCDMLYRP